MAVWLMMPLALALSGGPAIAYRDDTDLVSRDDLAVKANRAALVARAGDASLDDARMDLALKRKEEGTRCVCLRRQGSLEGDDVVLADMDEKGSENHFCAMRCSSNCGDDLKYKFGPSEAQAVGVEHVSSPVVAPSCDQHGFCWCLDAKSSTKNVEHYLKKRGRLKISDIVKDKGVYEDDERCLVDCERDCSGDYSGLCVAPWSWSSFLESSWTFARDEIGLSSYSLQQQFRLRRVGRGDCKVDLVAVLEEDKKVHEASGEVLDFHAQAGAEGTYHAEVGLGTERTTWVVTKRGGSRGWLVEKEEGKKDGASFTIKAKDGYKWKVKANGADKYFAKYEESERWVWRFFDKDREDGWGHRGKFDYSGDYCKVVINRKADAGLIIITSVLIANDLDLECL